MSRTDRQRGLIIWTLACTAVLHSGDSIAQRRPTGKPQPGRHTETASPAAKIDEIDAWLRRLEGRYSVRHGRNLGDGSCSTFAPGPGIRCIFDLPADENETISGPTVILYGIDTRDVGVTYLRVSPRGIAEWGVGELTGDTLRFNKVSCPKSVNQWPWLIPSDLKIRASGSMSILSCNRSMRIDAPHDGSTIQIQYPTELRVVLQTTGPSALDSRSFRTMEVNPKGSRGIEFLETIELKRANDTGKTGGDTQ